MPQTPASRPYNPGTVERWAKLFNSYDPSLPGNNPLYEREEVLWDPVAISDLMGRAYPGKGWYVHQGALNVSLALGRNRFGLHEIACKQYSTNKDSYLWARVSEVQHQAPILKDTSGNPVYEDRVTSALVKDALKTHGRANCVRCASYDLKMVRTALMCRRCGTMVGGF